MGLSLSECQHKCATDFDCNCISYEREQGICMKNNYCTPSECAPSSLVDTYLQDANYTKDGSSYNRRGGWECASNTAVSSHTNQTPDECLALCSADSTCGCIKYQRFYDKECTLQSGCPTLYTLPDNCNRSSSLDIYIKITR